MKVYPDNVLYLIPDLVFAAQGWSTGKLGANQITDSVERLMPVSRATQVINSRRKQDNNHFFIPWPR